MKAMRVVGGVVAVGVAAIAFTAANSMSDTTTRDASGTITEAGDLGVYKMRVGDCVIDPSMLGAATDESSEVSSFKAVPCDQPHSAEVVDVVDDFFTQDEYPGEDAAFDQGSRFCVASLETYTGSDYEDGKYDVFTIYPTNDTWSYDHDRGISCLAVTLDEDFNAVTTTGSVKAA